MSLKYSTLDLSTMVEYLKDRDDWPGDHLSLKSADGSPRFATIHKRDPLTVVPDDGEPSETFVSFERMVEVWHVD